MDNDGRYASQYAVDHCVCAYCWGVLVQRFDDELHRWVAVCADNDQHIGFHHIAFKAGEIDRHSIVYADVKNFYRETCYAKEFGLTPKLTGAALIDHAAKLKRMLGRDNSGLF
jgi:hypothetical protein